MVDTLARETLDTIDFEVYNEEFPPIVCLTPQCVRGMNESLAF